jgi:hypothetical protein
LEYANGEGRIAPGEMHQPVKIVICPRIKTENFGDYCRQERQLMKSLRQSIFRYGIG